MQDHYFISDVDGALHDTRQPNWAKTPLRPNYCRTHRHITSIADLKATLRAGEYAWPGGYPMFLITADGAALSFAAARREFRQIVQDHLWKYNTGWLVVACDINYEDDNLVCEHTGKPIGSAYGNA